MTENLPPQNPLAHRLLHEVEGLQARTDELGMEGLDGLINAIPDNPPDATAARDALMTVAVLCLQVVDWVDRHPAEARAHFGGE